MSLQNIIAKRGLSQAASLAGNAKVPIKMKQLPYEIGALEPVISGHLMEFHYGKHHRTYVNNLNKLMVEASEALERKDLQTYLSHLNAIKFNGGGHFNHEFFWECLAPINDGGGAIPDRGSTLRDDIESKWGTFENFEDYFMKETASLQGSGWGWLLYNKDCGSLDYRQTKNQDMPSDLEQNYVPLLTVDIWEHAYYLDYKN